MPKRCYILLQATRDEKFLETSGFPEILYGPMLFLDMFPLSYLNAVLYPGKFWSRYTSLGTQKMSPNNQAVLCPKVSFFRQMINYFFCVKFKTYL